MQSVTSAQFQVDLWIKKKDIYSDKIYWCNDIDGKITFDRPGLHHYLPPNFKIPVPPADLPEDIPLMTSSSEDSQDEGWMQRYEDRRRKQKADQTLLQLALHSHGKSGKDDNSSDSDSSSSTGSHTAMTAPSATGESVGSIQQFLRASRESVIAASSLSRPSVLSQEEATSVGFESSSAPLEPSVLLEGGKSESSVGGQKFSAKTKKEKSDNGDSSSSSGSDSESGSGSESENGTQSKASSSRASGSRSEAASSSQATSRREDSSVSQSVGNTSQRSVRTHLLNGAQPGHSQSNNLGSALELSQSVTTFSNETGGGLVQSQSSLVMYGLDEQEQMQQDQEQQQVLQLYDPSERYTEYWDEGSQMVLYWDNVDQNYQYWDESQQQYLICDDSQALVPATVRAGEDFQVSDTFDASGAQPLLLLTDRSQQLPQGPPPPPPPGGGTVVKSTHGPRYDFRRKMAELSTMYDEHDEEYVGAPHSLASRKLQEAVNLAKEYMERNRLYLQRQQLLAIGGGQLKKSQSSKRRKSSAVDKKATAHQTIDLYAKPSNLGISVWLFFYVLYISHFSISITDEEAAIVKQKAFQEYELAFKSIRKVRFIAVLK